MDIAKQQIDELMQEVFGISPEYTIVMTDKEWFEFHHPNPSWKAYWESTYPRDMMNYGVVRKHADKHTVEMPNGMKIEANFMVVHETRRVYLRVLHIEKAGDIYAKAYINDK